MTDPHDSASQSSVSQDLGPGDSVSEDSVSEDSPADGEGPPAPGSETSEPAVDAADEALRRVQAMARAKGLRPARGGARAPRAPATPGTGAGRTDRDPALLGEVVGRLVNDRGWEHQVEVGAVIGRWESIVGAEIAAHASPETFVEGVLVVRASSTSWATQLRLLANTLLTRIAQETGPDVVTELKIIGPSAPSWRHGRRGITGGRGPRDTYG